MKKIIKVIISLVLCVIFAFQPITASAATLTGKAYVKEMIISYGDTEDGAKAWLKDNGYKIIDNNLNEGADDIISTKRAVYLGYKTTLNADEAITDMRLMNMQGDYSFEDYQMLLDEQKANIRVFIDNFIVAVNEYRTNYNNGQERAVAAHDMLNMMYDDDTKQPLGDLFLNRVKEEYTDEEFNALSSEEQAKIADFTTILMQSNSTSVLALEQLISLATDSNDTLWSARYVQAKTYDEMIEDLMENENLTIDQAVKELAAEYDADAKAIASKFADYKEYLKVYTESPISLESTPEEIDAYEKANESFNLLNWTTAGTQYITLKALQNDDISLYDLITSDEYDIENADRYLLYPLASVLTKGQRACLDFLPMYQIVSLGINDDTSFKEAIQYFQKIFDKQSGKISIYDGVDRTIFENGVALTGEAYKLQNSTDKSAVKGMSDYLSTSTYVLLGSFFVSLIASAATLYLGFRSVPEIAATVSNSAGVAQVANNVGNAGSQMVATIERFDLDEFGEFTEAGEITRDAELAESFQSSTTKVGTSRTWGTVFKYVGITMTVITLVIMGVAAWNTYNELKEYYNAEFTPIPMHMVNEGVAANNEKTFTYYTAVKCNRQEQNMVTDSTKLLDDFGDLNGDVGRQWVALYTTKDKAAGNPVTTDFLVQYGNSDIPNDSCTALSIFCESVAQNLTNKKMGYTYSDGKNGIYLFFNTDSNAYVGSIFTNGTYALIGGCAVAAIAVIAYFVSKNTKKKKQVKAE